MHAQVCPVLLIMLPDRRTAGRRESETSQCSHVVAVRRRTKACQSLLCCVFFPRVSPLCNRLLSHIHAKSLRRQGWESILKSAQRLAALKNQPSSSNYVCFAHPSMDLWSLSYPLNQMSATQELSSRTSPTTHTGEPAEPQPGQPHERLWRGRSAETGLTHCFLIVMLLIASHTHSCQEGAALSEY